MDKFKEKYIEEAHELIEDLEKSLLILENSADDESQIHIVFRIMHTLKGNSSMFGFETVGDFTHSLETIYDLIRNGKLSITKDILDITLASIDHLKNLFNAGEELEGDLKEDHDLLIDKIEQVISGSEPEVSEGTVQFADDTESDLLKTFYINFLPDESIFDNGTNPLYLVDELTDIGNSFVNAYFDSLPQINDIEPLKSYFGWEVIISGEISEDEINDVFIFVEDEAEIEVVKIANKDLLSDTAFTKAIEEVSGKRNKLGLEFVNSFHIRELAEEVKTTSKASDKVISAAKAANVISSIRVSSQKLDQLMNLVSELVTTQARLSLFAEKSGGGELLGIAENVQKLSRQLRDIAFSVVLIPIESMMTRFQRLVRDLSKDLNKDIEFIIEGGDTELDKTVIEGLADPLMHILRNSIDHGIEDVSDRLNEGKPEQGVIHFKAFYSGANVIIQISDDGRGIDVKKIKEKAEERGLIAEDKKLSKKEILDLLFLPGFSTAKAITDVSGRGVGMDVVKRKIEEIRGDVEIDSEVSIGTTITIKLPLTLSIIDGLLVQLEDLKIILPLSSVHKIYAVEHKRLINTFNNVIVLDEQQLPFYYLRDEFNYPENKAEFEEVIVVNYEDSYIAIAVDTVIGEYQAVLKPLGKHYKDLHIFSGATILGDGTVALVMDTNRFIREYSNDDDHLINEG